MWKSFIALDKLHNQHIKKAVIVVQERSIGASFIDEPLNKLVALTAKEGVVASIFPSHDVDKKDLPLNQKYLNQLSASGWQVEQNEDTGFIVMR